MKEFTKHIRTNFGLLTKEEIEKLQLYFVEEKLSKQDFFAETNKYCKKLSLVKSGFLRIYAPFEEKEITQWISTPNYFVTEITSFFFDRPCRWSIQAISDVELWTIDKSSYLKLCEEMPSWKNIETQFIAKCFAMLEDRVFAHLSLSAEARYNLYFEQNRELFNQVPLQYIASVLGMSAETFSRIRKRQSESS